MEKQETAAARLTPSHLDEIRSSVDWQALFAGLGLKKAEAKSKAHDWWAFSPFHDEKTPSFHMGPGGLWYDFSLGEGGGAIELVQKLQNCHCFEAGQIILERGWTRASIDVSKVEQNSAVTRNRIGRTVDPIPSTPALENAPIRQDLIQLTTYHEVLEQRGISEETCTALGIGFLPQGRSPLKGRIVFQIADAREGKSDGTLQRVILSHLGRALSEKQEPKYLFYEGFHKSVELYGQEILWLHESAAEQIAETGSILLTEGPFDLAKAYEAGLRNALASFGASLSPAQAEKLKTLADHFNIEHIIIAYDRDEPGLKGAEKAAALLTKHGLTPKLFDWEAPIAKTKQGVMHIPKSIHDLCDLRPKQIAWLRLKGML